MESRTYKAVWTYGAQNFQNSLLIICINYIQSPAILIHFSTTQTGSGFRCCLVFRKSETRCDLKLIKDVFSYHFGGQFFGACRWQMLSFTGAAGEHFRFRVAEITFSKGKSMQKRCQILKFSPAAPCDRNLRFLTKAKQGTGGI